MNAISLSYPTVGAYVLRYGGSVVYVGQSRNVLSRIKGHPHAFDSVDIYPCERDELTSLECCLIARFKPKANKVANPDLYLNPARPTPARCKCKRCGREWTVRDTNKAPLRCPNPKCQTPNWK